MTLTSKLQKLDSLLLIVILVETVEVTVCDICPTSMTITLNNILCGLFVLVYNFIAK